MSEADGGAEQPGGRDTGGEERPEERPAVAILLMVVAMSVVPFMDAFAKLLSRDLPVEQVAWARFVFGLLFILPIALYRYGPRVTFRPKQPALQFLRGLLTAASSLFFFSAISMAPIADALALIFIAPLVVTALSPFVLQERVGIHRWAAVWVGFAGALIIIRPGLGSIDLAMLLAAGAGVSHGFFLLVTRRLSRSGPPLATLTVTTLVGALVLAFLQPFVWTMPEPHHWLYFAAMGFCAALGHFLLIKAFEQGTATLLAPFGYSEIVAATALGFFIFGDFPDRITWLGIVVIVASGLYITFRERVRGRLPAARLRK